MPSIRIYTRRFCAYCTAAKSLLAQHDYPFEEISLDEHPDLTAEVMQRSGQRTVPQIFVDETSVGGFRELHAMMNSGEFAGLVATGNSDPA